MKSTNLVLILLFLISCSCSLSSVGYSLFTSSTTTPSSSSTGDSESDPSSSSTGDSESDPSSSSTNTASIPCEGYYTDPVCPFGCGLGASTLQRTWMTTNDPTDIASCPSPSTKSCPATSECMAYEVYYASNIPFPNDPSARISFDYDPNSSKSFKESVHLCAKKCNSNSNCKGFKAYVGSCMLFSDAGTREKGANGRLNCDDPTVRYNFRKSSTPPTNNCTHFGGIPEPNPTLDFPRYP